MNQYIHGCSKAIYSIFVFTLLLGSEAGCSGMLLHEEADTLFFINDHVDYYYELKAPDEKHFLPYALSEISGLTYKSKDRILCVEDEEGKVYEYDLKKKKVTRSIEFEKSGDYEGVEIVDNIIYVLRSDGDVYSFEESTDKKVKSDKEETELSSDNDTEGLGFNPYSGHLLIACKGDEDTDETKAKGKAVYEYNIKSQKLEDEPIFEIRTKHLKEFFEANRQFEFEEDRIRFEPSGIAYNPIDGYFYVIASAGKLMVVLDKKGKIMATYPISPRTLNQPEGICFAPNGDLYISSEGGDDKGYILKFSIKSK